ncbi:hypothetical protein BX666DRAFT_1855940 [Dichotomocladium elegans]|nr:hypothetical protein BX666DRAFT_1855940 [Dichotomocladium elegans]
MHGLVPPGIPKIQNILVARPAFVTQLSQIVVEDANTRTLQTYLIWRTVWKYLDTLGEEFIAPRRRLYAKLLGLEVRARHPRWQFCLSQVDASLGFLLGRYFLKENMDERAAVQVEDVIKSLTDTFMSRLDQLDWVAAKDEDNIANKMKYMDAEVGYPRSGPDMGSSISLAEYYEKVDVDRAHFFQNVLGANQAAVKRSWAHLREPTGAWPWDITPQHLGLEYHPSLNKLEVPGAMLGAPFYETYAPEYLNYGSLGVTISHATLEGFDTIGRLINDEGRIGSWWSNETREAYDRKSKCFASQYSGFSVQGPDGKEYHVDGERTLSSNIADNGGLLLAYISWQQRFESGNYNNKLLPGLDAWTRDQLFYINFARMWCSKSTAENDMHDVLVGMHAPDKWRVNGAVMNSEHFASAFSCPVNSAMNPRNKCSLW